LKSFESSLESRTGCLLLIFKSPSVEYKVFSNCFMPLSRDESCPCNLLNSKSLLSDVFNEAYFAQRQWYPMWMLRICLIVITASSKSMARFSTTRPVSVCFKSLFSASTFFREKRFSHLIDIERISQLYRYVLPGCGIIRDLHVLRSRPKEEIDPW
jgi:hypothetical protein